MFSKIEWNAVPIEQVNPSMRRRLVTGERLTVAQIWFTDGFRVPQHSHHQEQITQVVSGRMRFWMGADRAQMVEVDAGEVIVIAPHVVHEALCIGEVYEIDIWSPRRDDWLNKTDAYLMG